MKELVSSIENGIKKITKGDITLSELEQIVDSSRELYERLLIVRFKVYENSILTTESSQTDMPTLILNEVPLVKEIEVEEKIEEVSITGVTAENEIIFEDLEEYKPEDSIIRFDLFDAPNIEKPLDDKKIEGEDLNNTEKKEFIIEEVKIEEVKEEHLEEVIEDKEIGLSDAASNLIPKLEKLEKSIAQNYQIMPIETLIGSFTLNERLQFINELFDGSSDLFSSSIKRLDTQDTLIAVHTIIAEIAVAYSWDIDGEVVEDFMLKLCSRYASNRAN